MFDISKRVPLRDVARECLAVENKEFGTLIVNYRFDIFNILATTVQMWELTREMSRSTAYGTVHHREQTPEHTLFRTTIFIAYQQRQAPMEYRTHHLTNRAGPQKSAQWSSASLAVHRKPGCFFSNPRTKALPGPEIVFHFGELNV